MFLVGLPLKQETLTAMSKRNGIQLVQVVNNRKAITEWDDLLRAAVKKRFGNTARPRRSWKAENDKREFLRVVFSDATNISSGNSPEVISMTTVDVNEKVYTNCQGKDDETLVKIMKSVEDFEGHNYTVSTTKGVEWGLKSNLGLQFGLPGHLVGGAKIGAEGGIEAHFTKKKQTTVTEETRKSSTLRSEAHHQETVKIPPGKKAVVKMTLYKVRYKLAYTMEYKVPKTTRLRVSYEYGTSLCAVTGYLTAAQLLESLDGYRQDDDNVYFTQQGVLRWIADRMVVDKDLLPV